jgi:hypothetical protein
MTTNNLQSTDSQEESQILIYESDSGEVKIDVLLENETVWLTQDKMATLFGKAKNTVSEHIQNIFKEGELDSELVIRNFRQTTRHGAIEGKTQQTEVKLYNLDVIISVGYRVKSKQGTAFRKWATQRLREYIVKGFVLNDQRFKTGNSLNYFDELQARIREIRLSEKLFYQKIKDIYKTSIDYDSQDSKTIEFFKRVQNKLLWAVSSQTAAELVHARSDHALPLMGMLSFDKDTDKSITKQNSSIAKNYLNEDEMKLLGLLVEQYLAFAETMASQKQPMYMQDWIKKLDSILELNGRELLTHAGKISHDQAVKKAGDEYQKYRQKQKEEQKKASLKELEQDLKELGKVIKTK